MDTAEVIERLQRFPKLAGVPREELDWLVTRGRLEHYEQGVVIGARGQVHDKALILLAGHYVHYSWQGGTRRKVMEGRAGSFLGVLPYSRLKVYGGEGVAAEACDVLAVDRELFPEMIRDCHELTAAMVHDMLDRARQFNTIALHDEKMVSLGKLSAGLAHELNNPASAIVGSARQLAARLTETDETARAFWTTGLDQAQIAAVEALRDSCLNTRTADDRSPLERADHEDELTDWLVDHGVDPDLAVTLAETAITLEALDRLAATLAEGSLTAALRWVADSCQTRRLTDEIGGAASRINQLVTAVKGFTHMDRARALQPTDVGQCLADTLAMLEGKARERKVVMTLDLAPGLPPVWGYGGELNQVWMNLIDNALDAVPEEGRVEVTAAVEAGRVVVRVVDNGKGIPKEDLPFIFDPFFTTKEVGEGAGLGLDIARRLIRGHEGEISVESRPGRTEFRVDLPVTDSP